jgi:hypothetical protein
MNAVISRKTREKVDEKGVGRPAGYGLMGIMERNEASHARQLPF